MTQKKVSVIIPAYKAGKYVSQTLDSIINQTFKNLDIIIIDDGSSDNTSEIILKYCKRDSRINYYFQENKGCSASKNAGLLKAKGEFIQYLDADDILSPEKIEIQMKSILDKPNAIAVCNTVIIGESIDQSSGYIDAKIINKQGSGFEFLLRLLGSEGKCGMVQPNAYLIPKQIAEKIGEWNDKISPSPDEDGEYFTRALLCAEEVVFTEGINFYRKLTNNGSLSQKYSFDRVCNLLETVDLKFKHIFEIESSIRTMKLYQLNISQVVYQFGIEYPELVPKAKKMLAKRGVEKFEINLPWRFALASRIFGFTRVIFFKRILFVLISHKNKKH